MAGGKKAWVTLATNDTYGLGALVLAHSLKKANTAYDLAILVTSNVTQAMRGALSAVFDQVKEVNVMDSGDVENLRLLARPELGITFTKLHCWRLTQYDKCVFLDADTLVLKNCDELFDREELSAAPDVGWPDCFNSGVFVFKPSEETYNAIEQFALTHGSFDGGDQGLLNMYFSTWSTGDSSKRLPFLYNLSSTAIYSYLPAFTWFGKDVKIVHFIGTSKPWTQSFNPITRTVYSDPHTSHLTNFLQYWWDIFCNNVHSQLSPEMTRTLLRNWLMPYYSYVYKPPFWSYPSRATRRNDNDAIGDDYEKSTKKTPNEQRYVFRDPWDEFENEANFDRIDDNVRDAIEQIADVITRYNVYENDRNATIDNGYGGDGGDVVVVERITTNEERGDGDGAAAADDYRKYDNYSKDNNVNCTGDDDVFDNTTSSLINNIVDTNTNIEYRSSSASRIPNANSTLPPPPHLLVIQPSAGVMEINNSNRQFNDDDDSGLVMVLAQMKLDEPTAEQLAAEDARRRENWEHGNIDYMGRDSFDNIWSKISETIGESVTKSSDVSDADLATVPSQPISAPVEESSATITETTGQQIVEPVSCPRQEVIAPVPQPPQPTEIAAQPSVESRLPATPTTTSAPSTTVLTSPVPETSPPADACQITRKSEVDPAKSTTVEAEVLATSESQEQQDKEPPPPPPK